MVSLRCIGLLGSCFLASILFTACHHAAPDSETEATLGEATAVSNLLLEAELRWAQRDDEAALREALYLYESATELDPLDREVLVRLVRGWTFLANGHLTDPGARSEVLARSMKWADRCRALDAAFLAVVTQGRGPEARTVRFRSRNHLPCLLWSTEALVSWAELQGPSTYLREVERAHDWMVEIQEADPGYHFGAPDRFLGEYYRRIPTFAGQDPIRAHQHLERAISVAPEWFDNRVLLAESSAVESGDRALFETQLRLVIEGDVTRLADWTPEQRAAQRHAARLLEQADALFAPSP